MSLPEAVVIVGTSRREHGQAIKERYAKDMPGSHWIELDALASSYVCLGGSEKIAHAINGELSATLAKIVKKGENVAIFGAPLSTRYRRRLYTTIMQAGYRLGIVDLRDDLERIGAYADEDRAMYEQIKDDLDEEVAAINACYQPDPSGDIVVDIDGTLARHVSRAPHEYHRVGEDAPIHENIELLRALMLSEYSGLYAFSGRSESCRVQTKKWLEDQGIYVDGLKMRVLEDQRPDWIVKAEIMQEHISSGRSVKVILDDRQQIVDIWHNMGLRVLQVDQGRF